MSLKARRDPAAMLSVSQYNLPTLREDLAEEVSRLADKLNGLHFVCSTFAQLFFAEAEPADLEYLRDADSKECRIEPRSAGGVCGDRDSAIAGAAHAQRRDCVGGSIVPESVVYEKNLAADFTLKGGDSRGGCATSLDEQADRFLFASTLEPVSRPATLRSTWSPSPSGSAPKYARTTRMLRRTRRFRPICQSRQRRRRP